MRRPHPLGLLGAALVAAGFLVARGARVDGGNDTPAGVFGPIADVASDLSWVGVRQALRAGEPTRAIVLAERAVTFDPTDPLGWQRYGALLGTELASPAGEPDPAARLAWVRAALAVYARGEARSTDPGELALARAVLLLSRHELDPDLPWPGGPIQPLDLAAVALDDAARTLPFAADLADAVRARARSLR